MNLDPQKLNPPWDAALPVIAVRMARPTDQLRALMRFYGEGLGLRLIGSFEGHEGFSGALYGLPGAACHLEFTQEDGGSPGAAPGADNNLVLYMPDAAAIAALARRMAEMGYASTRPVNPYWEHHGACVIPDPDGWNVILTPEVADFMLKDA
ncbi:MAG TPA: VOC family protein [Burkholderiales bacterium]|jgi:hypothetical protein|nr:VOC family protein [Burkholderiales bacterium]